MQTPYEKTYRFPATLGGDNWFVLNIPPRGWLSKLIVCQTAGTPVDFTVDIYNKDVSPADSLSSGSSLSSEADDCDLFLHQVLPQQSAVAGARVELFGSDNWFIYENLDNGRTNREYKLYMRLSTVGGVGPAEFGVAIATSIPG